MKRKEKIYRNNQGQGGGYQLKPKAGADNPYRDLDYSGYQKPHLIIVLLYIQRKKKVLVFNNFLDVLLSQRSKPRSHNNYYFCFFMDGKQHKACELDMITLRNRALQSYMT